MNKCLKCGTEFEGKFCPECGEPWAEDGEKTCPRCGAAVKEHVKFCSACGYSFIKQSEPAAPAAARPSPAPAQRPAPATAARPSPSPAQRPARSASSPSPARTGSALYTVYRVLTYLPAALFALFGVLAFIFLAGPATKVTSAGAFLGVMDVGSGYHVLSVTGVDKLRGPALGLLVLSVLGIVYAGVLAFATLKGKKCAPLLGYGAFALYLACLIAGSVLIANTASMDEGLGVLKAGACPVCFLVFAILFAVFHAASLLACKILKKNAEVAKAEKTRAAEKAARLAAFHAAHTPPLLKKPATKRDEVVYKYKKRYYERGKEKEPAAAIVFLDMHKVLLLVLAAVLILAVVLMATLIPMLNNKFRVALVKKISLGDGKEAVVRRLGEPFGGDRESDDWFYYDGSLTSYVEKAQNLALEQEKALEQGNFTKAEQLAQEANALAEQVKSKAFKCIEVTFAEGQVTSVLLDTRYAFEPQAKEVEEEMLLSDLNLGYYLVEMTTSVKYEVVTGADDPLPYETHYVDGSFYKAYITNGTVERQSDSTCYYTWVDKFGSHSDEIEPGQMTRIGKIEWDGYCEIYGSGLKELGLIDLILPNSVRIIGKETFSDCKELTSVTIGSDITEIDSSAFDKCSALEGIYVDADNSNYGKVNILGDKFKYLIANGKFM